MDSPITVGIIGYGLIGRTHAQALAGVDGTVLQSIASRRGQSAANPDETYLDDARWYHSPDDLYANGVPDVMAICSPSGDHADQIRAALEHGAHVLAEKPPAGDAGELQELIDLARNRGRTLAVVSQQRLEPQLMHVARVIHHGALGRPLLGEVRLHWHRPQSYYDDAPWRATDAHGGSLANQGWHAVDLLTWFFGPASAATAQTATIAHDVSIEDTTVASVRFRSAAMGSIVTTTATPPGEPAEIRMFFERGAVTIHDTKIVEWHAPDDVPAPPSATTTASGAADPAAIGAIGHHRQWADLATAIRTETPPAVPAEQSLHTLALIDAVYRSADTGKAVTIGEETS